LLELLIRVQTKPRFTAAELAEEFGVSRRTMLRDLSALSAMGVPLRSTPGPGGGYSLPRGGRRLSPSLTVDEALALIASYEALLRYPVHPFSTQSLSAVTKLRAALPREVVAELDRLRRHVFVAGPAHDYEAPLLGELLSAALDGTHLKVTYDSIESGITERVIFPYGLYASQGYWYCACFDHKRGTNVPMRADRFLSAEKVEGFEPPQELSVRDWMNTAREAFSERLWVRARVTERGRKSFELTSLFGRITPEEDGVIATSPGRLADASGRLPTDLRPLALRAAGRTCAASTGRSNPTSPAEAPSARLPRPARSNTCSTNTALPKTRPISMPSIARIGSSELRSTWRASTRDSGAPFARAVRTYVSCSSLMTWTRIIRE
jgi:predicted DNA-binding transcriptional regulator YafY